MFITGDHYLLNNGLIPVVYDLETQKWRFVAPMPEQSGTPTMHFPEVSRGTYQKFSSPKLRKLDQTDVFQNCMLYQWGNWDPNNAFLQCPRGAISKVNMCLLRLQGNAFLGSHFVLAWVQRISFFGPLDHRLIG